MKKETLKAIRKERKPLNREEAPDPPCGIETFNGWEHCTYKVFKQTGQCAGYFVCLKGYKNVKECPYHGDIVEEIKREEEGEINNGNN